MSDGSQPNARKWLSVSRQGTTSWERQCRLDELSPAVEIGWGCSYITQSDSPYCADPALDQMDVHVEFDTNFDV
jgi:hypothetical protein